MSMVPALGKSLVRMPSVSYHGSSGSDSNDTAAQWPHAARRAGRAGLHLASPLFLTS
jgi:hypothetical protein